MEETQHADILLHVVDSTAQNIEANMETVYETLANLKALGKPIITLYNKCDKDPLSIFPIDNRAEKTIKISAKNKQGLDDLLSAVEEILKADRKEIKALVPYSDIGILQLIKGQGEKLIEDYRPEGIYKANVSQKYAIKWKNILLNSSNY